MNRQAFRWVLLLVWMALLGAAASAADKAAEVCLSGKVCVQTEGDMVTGLSLQTAAGPVRLKLDEQGRRLAALQGQQLRVHGQWSEKGRTFRVTRWQATTTP